MPHEGLYCVKEDRGVCLDRIGKGGKKPGEVGSDQGRQKVAAAPGCLLTRFKFAGPTDEGGESDGEKSSNELKLRGGQNRL